MSIRTGSAACAMVALALAAAHPAEAGEFQLRSSDGVEIRGESAANAPSPAVAVIFVPGTGLFDRDAHFGDTGTPRDRIFKDLAQRLLARGVASVRFDVRGVRYGLPPEQSFDRTLLAGRTTGTMRDDLAAIYGWARSPEGLGARCIVFFAHSEGMLHVGRLAAAGEPAPALVIGMGAGMESPAQIIRWQSSERDALSLELMDADRDGTVTNAEVEANWRRTPSSVFGKVEPFLHPSGAWTPADIAEVRTIQTEFYLSSKREALARADSEPFPDAENASASYQWWKSWYLDETPAAANLARWQAPVILHYGDKDSQTSAATQSAAATAALPRAQVTVHVHPGKGHTLGPDVLFGPIDEPIAEQIADEAAAVAASCR